MQGPQPTSTREVSGVNSKGGASKRSVPYAGSGRQLRLLGHYFFAVLAVVCMIGAVSHADEGSAAPEFNRVQAVLRQYCAGCHSAQEPEHDLVLETYEGILAGGKSGAVVLPGEPDNSRLLLMVEGKLQPSMPPEGNEAPTPDEIALLRAWIEAGAPGPTGEVPDRTLLVTPHVPLLAPVRRVINSVAFSPDGKLLAVAEYNGVRLVSAESRATLRRLEGIRGNVTEVSFSADGNHLLAAAGEPGLFGEAVLWHVADGTVAARFLGHTDSLNCAALSPDGTLAATGSYDQTVIIWDVVSGQALRTIKGHNGAVFDLAFHPRRGILATASGDRTIKLWDVASGARLETFGQPLKEQYAVAFSPDGRYVAGGGVDNRIRVWQLSETAQEGTNPLLLTRFAHEGAIIRLVYSPDGATLVSAAEDRTVTVWDTSGYVQRLELERQPDWVPALDVASDNRTLAAGRLDGSLAFYDLSNGSRLLPPKPELAGISPRGAQRGVRARLVFKGKNLAEPQAVILESRELAISLPADVPQSAEQLTLDVLLSDDLPLGTRRIALLTAGGSSNELAFEVDVLPQLVEQESNDSVPQAQAIAAPASVWGVLSARGDVDHYIFEGSAGQTIVCELASRRLGGQANGSLALLDARGRVLAANNDFDGMEDPVLAWKLSADGRYVVRVGDLSASGSEQHFYRLTVGALPFVTGVYPLAVPAGEPAAVQLVGYNLPPDATVPIEPGPPGERHVPLDRALYRSAREFSVLATAVSDVLESEPNERPEQATPLAVPGAASGRIAAASGADVDLYRFAARQGESWIIETEAERRGSPLDTRIEVLHADGRPVERLLLQAVRDSWVEFRPVDSNQLGMRPKNWEEMELNEYLYLQGEVVKIFRLPQGPDSEIVFYSRNGRRRCYFDTSATAHPLDEPLYTVQPYSPGTALVPNGLPVFTLYYANDDDGERRLGRDSRLTFTAPADGDYLVRVTDVRGFGGSRFAYRLTVRKPQPGFRVSLANANPTVNAGSGRRLSFVAERIDGFEGEIALEVSNLPAGYAVSAPLSIQEGHIECRAVLTAAEDAQPQPPEAWQSVSVTARAWIDGQEIVQNVGSLGQVTLAPKPKVIVRIEPTELVIEPGTTITAQLKIERNGYDDLVTFEADNLPHGVIVDNIGLNGVLIRAGETERTIFLTASRWLSDLSRPFQMVEQQQGGQSSPPVMLHVRRQSVAGK